MSRVKLVSGLLLGLGVVGGYLFFQDQPLSDGQNVQESNQGAVLATKPDSNEKKESQQSGFSTGRVTSAIERKSKSEFERSRGDGHSKVVRDQNLAGLSNDFSEEVVVDEIAIAPSADSTYYSEPEDLSTADGYKPGNLSGLVVVDADERSEQSEVELEKATDVSLSLPGLLEQSAMKLGVRCSRATIARIKQSKRSRTASTLRANLEGAGAEVENKGRNSVALNNSTKGRNRGYTSGATFRTSKATKKKILRISRLGKERARLIREMQLEQVALSDREGAADLESVE